MTRPLDVMALAAIIVAAGCSEAFDPTVAGPRPFAVFAPLHAGSDTQVVRLTATLAPSDPSPVIAPVSGAVVTVAGPGGPVVFQPVAVPGEPGTSDSVIVEYRAAGFRPARGGAYTLQVQTPAGTATAAIVVPSSIGTPLAVRDPYVLSQPHSYPLETPIVVNVAVSNEALGFMVRLLIEYEVYRNGVWERELAEVPLAYTGIASGDALEPILPTLVRRASSVSVGGGLPPPEPVFFNNLAYEETISLIYARHGRPNVQMRRALFVLLQVDRHLFTYFAYANSFEDRFTIRLDQPDYSNVRGALGIFGGLASDTLAESITTIRQPR
ncbi:MAG: DUF4249 domain-containing protein [Bacteroidetes bacterium]|jgi:hypothetical protein|nr:DUF4249 domain-containing protein [Bacteroidota bacterium]